jgi:hypothetical protein
MAGVADELAASPDEDLVAIGARLAEGVAVAREATNWLIEHGLEDPNDAMAGSTPYLRLLATVTGAWILGRSALVARSGDATEDQRFLDAKVVTARFFADNLLPPELGQLEAVRSGADPLFADCLF